MSNETHPKGFFHSLSLLPLSRIYKRFRTAVENQNFVRFVLVFLAENRFFFIRTIWTRCRVFVDKSNKRAHVNRLNPARIYLMVIVSAQVRSTSKRFLLKTIRVGIYLGIFWYTGGATCC